MVARMARLLILVQCLFGAGVFFFMIKVLHLQNSWMALTISVALVSLIRLSITINGFRLSGLFRHKSCSEFPLGWRQSFHIVRTEFIATMLSSSWSMAFCSFEKRPASNPVGLPVLLIHGYGCNSGYWHWMSKKLRRARIMHHAVNLEPVLAGIDGYGELIHRAAEALCRDSGSARLIIVAHSMGGLASRAYLRDYGSARIEKVITLGTPHRGTGLANHGPGLNSRQMRRDIGNDGAASDWLLQLKKTESTAITTLFVSLYSHHDNIVWPQQSAHLDRATNIGLQGIGHVALALDDDVQQRVISEILSASMKQP